MRKEVFEKRIKDFYWVLVALLNFPPFRFDASLRKSLPTKQGIYRIFDGRKPEITIRAGRTILAARGLQQRIYGNHFMGNQAGNLRQQLVNSRRADDLEGAKRLIKEHYWVQWAVIDDYEERKWAEYYVLAVLQPEFSDRLDLRRKAENLLDGN